MSSPEEPTIDTEEGPATATEPAVKASPEAPEREPYPRVDLLVVSHNPSFNMVEQGLSALMNFIHAGNVARATDESVAKTWTEIYCVPGATPHEPFVRHGYDVDAPPFLQFVVHNALKPEALPWGQKDGEGAVRFWLEFRGCLFEDFDGRFKNRLREALNTRFEVRTRPFTELPPQREVPPGEEAIDVKRAVRDRVSSRVGTAVEEF